MVDQINAPIDTTPPLEVDTFPDLAGQFDPTDSRGPNARMRAVLAGKFDDPSRLAWHPDGTHVES